MQEMVLTVWDRYRGLIVELGKDGAAALIIAAAGFAAGRAACGLVRRASAGAMHVDVTITPLVYLVIRYGIFIICLIMILNVFGVNTASLLALLGAAGIAVGLALKDTLGNIAAGIILLFLGSYRRGDYIEFGSYSGTVQEISLFTTILETPDGVFISAPNSSIWGTPLKNYTRNGKRRMDISVPVSYTDSLDAAFGAARELVASDSRFLAEPPPQITVQSYGDSCVYMLVRAWAPLDVYWAVYQDLMCGIRKKFDEAGLSVPFPRQDVRLYTEEKQAGQQPGPQPEQ